MDDDAALCVTYPSGVRLEQVREVRPAGSGLVDADHVGPHASRVRRSDALAGGHDAAATSPPTRSAADLRDPARRRARRHALPLRVGCCPRAVTLARPDGCAPTFRRHHRATERGAEPPRGGTSAGDADPDAVATVGSDALPEARAVAVAASNLPAARASAPEAKPRSPPGARGARLLLRWDAVPDVHLREARLLLPPRGRLSVWVNAPAIRRSIEQ